MQRNGITCVSDLVVNMMNFLFDGIKLPNSYEEEKILDVIIDKVTKQLRGGENIRRNN